MFLTKIRSQLGSGYEETQQHPILGSVGVFVCTVCVPVCVWECVSGCASVCLSVCVCVSVIMAHVQQS